MKNGWENEPQADLERMAAGDGRLVMVRAARAELRIRERIAAEREACAKLMDAMAEEMRSTSVTAVAGGYVARGAAGIRARRD